MSSPAKPDTRGIRKGRGVASNNSGRYEVWQRVEIDGGWGQRMQGTGLYADLIRQRFEISQRRLKFPGYQALDKSLFQPPVCAGQQLELL